MGVYKVFSSNYLKLLFYVVYLCLILEHSSLVPQWPHWLAHSVPQTPSCMLFPYSRLLHLIGVIAHAHASTHVTSLMHAENKHMPLLFMTHCLGHWNEENERKIKNIKLNGWSFFLTFVSLLLAWMLYFHVWLRMREKFKVWSKSDNQYQGIIQEFNLGIGSLMSITLWCKLWSWVVCRWGVALFCYYISLFCCYMYYFAIYFIL